MNYYLESVTIELAKITEVELNQFNNHFSTEDLELNEKQVLSELRSCADGVAINLLEHWYDLADIEISESIEKIYTGNGGVKERVHIKIPVAKPNYEQLNQILRVSKFPYHGITFSFLVEKVNPLEVNSNIKDDYIVLSSDDKGLKFTVQDDLFATVLAQEGNLHIRLETKYDWQFHTKVSEFDVNHLVKTLVE